MDNDIAKLLENIKAAAALNVEVLQTGNLSKDFVEAFVKAASALDLAEKEINICLSELSNLKSSNK